MPFLNTDWGTSVFLDRDPAVIGPRRVAFGGAGNPFILPVTWTIKRLLEASLLVTWDILADALQFAELPVTWIVLQQPNALGVIWTILPGNVGGGDNNPTGTPAPIQSAFNEDIQQPTATASAP